MEFPDGGVQALLIGFVRSEESVGHQFGADLGHVGLVVGLVLADGIGQAEVVVGAF